MWTGAAYDCQRCGACCADQDSSPDMGYVYLDRVEARRMRRMGLSVVQDGGDAFLGARPCDTAGLAAVCVALEGRIGDSCQCAIYAARPRNCRRFEMGGTLCRSARQQAGLPV